jgi:hypothetical protein
LTAAAAAAAAAGCIRDERTRRAETAARMLAREGRD